MVQNQNLRHRWSLLCSKSSIDVQSNNLSLFNIIDQINISTELFAGKKPGAIPMDIELVTLWEKTGEAKDVEADVEVELQDPEGNSLGSFPYAVSMPKRRHRHFLKLNGLPITEKSGRYTFKVRKKEKGESRFVEAGEVPVELKLTYTFPKQRQHKKV